MIIKVHFLHSHLDKFLDDCSDISDKQGEQFHQDIKTMEKHYQGWWDKQIMADKVSKGTCITLNVTNNQQNEKGFISAVSLLNDLMKILVGLGEIVEIKGKNDISHSAD